MSIQRGNPRSRSGNRNQQRFSVQALPPTLIIQDFVLNDDDTLLIVINGPIVLTGGDLMVVEVAVPSKLIPCYFTAAPVMDGTLCQVSLKTRSGESLLTNKTYRLASNQHCWRSVFGGFIGADYFKMPE